MTKLFPIYNKKGKLCKCTADQLETMLAAGYKVENPVKKEVKELISDVKKEIKKIEKKD